MNSEEIRQAMRVKYADLVARNVSPLREISRSGKVLVVAEKIRSSIANPFKKKSGNVWERIYAARNSNNQWVFDNKVSNLLERISL